MEQNPDELVFACAVIRQGKKVLIVRPHGQGHRAKWAFPADMVRPEESPEAACRRMAEEKLGADLAIDFGQPPLQDTVEGKSVIYRYFFGHVAADVVQNLDFAEVRWVQAGQLPEYEFDPTSEMVAQWLMKNL